MEGAENPGRRAREVILDERSRSPVGRGTPPGVGAYRNNQRKRFENWLRVKDAERRAAEAEDRCAKAELKSRELTVELTRCKERLTAGKGTCYDLRYELRNLRSENESLGIKLKQLEKRLAKRAIEGDSKTARERKNDDDADSSSSSSTSL